MFVKIADFVGKYELHTGMFDQAKLQEYIDIYEKRYLIELFGAELYNDFVADLTPSISNPLPQSPNFQYVFYPFYENVMLHTIIQSEGIKQMLKGFIYFEYLKDTTNQITPNGVVIPSNENSTTASTLYTMMYARYNEAMRSFRAIQTHITINTNQPIGQIVQFTLSNIGTGYSTQADVPTTSTGNGVGSTFDIVDNGSGGIDQIALANGGSNYSVGDVVTLQGGNNDAQLVVDFIGAGNYRKFNGICKQYAYWM